MKTRSRSFLYYLVSIAVVIAYLATAVSVRADDESPPAPTEAPVVDVSPTEEPVATEEAAAETEPAPTSNPETDLASTPEADTLAEVLESAPEGVDVVVLDENGNPLPLASQEAADAILSDPDPMWCPDGALPGDAACTSYFNRFTTATGLINTLQSGSYSGPGTIYVSSGNIAGADQNKNIVLNGNSMLTLSSDNLTIQGGWDFGSNTVINRSVFVNSTFEIRNWTGNITINDLKFELAGGISGDGLTIKNIDGNVTLNNVVITDSQNDNGLFINNINNIEINDSRFSDNYKNGADLNADGTIALNNVIARDNGEHGVDAHADGNITIVDGTYQHNDKRGVRAQSDNGDIDVTGSEFINNQMSGIRAEAHDGDITLSDIYSARNDIHGANLGAAGDITINGGSDFINNDGSGVHIMGLIGSLFVSESSVFSKNDGHGLDAEYIFGDAEIDNSFFELNKKNGLNLPDVGGSINITSSDFLDNKHNGAVLDNSCGCAMGNIFISSSSFDFNGSSTEGRGLVAHSNGDIMLTDVAASGNGGNGAELVNCFFNGSDCDNTNPAKITITGTNTFNDNGSNLYPSVGLWVESNSGVTLDGVTARGNGLGLGGGAFIGTYSGNISITNSNFSDNCKYCEFGFGFVAVDGGGDITLNRVTANGNGNDPINGYTDPAIGLGAVIVNLSGNTLVKNSDFSSNCTLEDCFGVGIGVLSFGSVYFDHVTANGNGSSFGFGAQITANNNVDIYCSTFNNNAGFGISADIPGGSVMTLNGVTLSGNAIGPLDFSDTLVENPFDCNPGGGRDKKPVPVSAGVCVGLAANASFKTPKGDFATFPCPINDQAFVQPLSEDKLPGALGDGQKFLSALVTKVIRDNKPVDELENAALVSFIIPEGVDQTSLAILFWDGTQWTELGGELSADGLRFEVSTNLVGTFVLVQK